MPDEKPQPEPEYKRLADDDLRDYVDKMLDFLARKYLAEHPTEENDTQKGGEMKEFFEPPTVDLALLRHFVEEAKRRQETKTADRAEICRALRVSAEEIQRHEDEIAANRIIVQIPARAEFEAQHEGKHASIMSFNGKDVSFKFCDPGWLTGPAKLVYDFCEKAGLQPTLEFWEYWPDRDGPTRSGFHLVIHW